MQNADSVGAGKPEQQLLPIALQEEARAIAIANVRLINCWIGIATKENIGSTFCVDCEYLATCRSLYRIFDGTAKLHPAARAREILRRFGIDSEYL